MKHASKEISEMVATIQRLWKSETGTVPNVCISFHCEVHDTYTENYICISANKFETRVRHTYDMKQAILAELKHFLKL
jgi:hypothetical protein